MSENNIDVLIVGAGPVGLFCAHELMRHGLTCRIIDRKQTISDKSKALGIHIRTLDMLEDCGLLDDFIKQGLKVEGALVKSRGETLVNATFSVLTEADRQYLIDLPQNETEAILYKHLQNKSIKVEWETELTHLSQSAGEVTATIKKPNNQIELLNANWLIACDGAHSTVRHQMGAEFKGSSYKQAWWLADLFLDWSLPQNRMVIFLHKNGPLACFPMGNKRYRIVMTLPVGHSNQAGVDPTLEQVDKEFKERSSDAAILSNPIWLSQFSIHHRQIDHYRYERVFFAGDAAHIHSPMGGQGLNTGLQDIYNLVWKLSLVTKKMAYPQLLNSYHDERFAVGQAVLRGTDRMTRMILLTNPIAIAIRNMFMKCFSSIPRIRHHMARGVAELSITYKKSFIVHALGCSHGIKVGEMIPNFTLTDQLTKKVVASQAIAKGTLHHLFIFSGLNSNLAEQALEAARKLATRFSRTIKVHLVTVIACDEADEKMHIWLDEHEQVHRHFGFKKPALLLVRPDKYIGVLQKKIDIDKFITESYLS